MTLTFDEPTHTYRLDGVRVPSVTQVLDPLIDFSALPGFVREKALTRGRIVHDAIHADNALDLDEAAFRLACPEEAPYLDAWRTFRTASRFVPVLNEHRVASPRHKVAGTLDTLGHLDGVAALLDFKTGKPADVSADLQTAGYLVLAVEWAVAGGDDALRAFLQRHPVIRRFAIHLRPDATYRVEAYTNAADMRDFLTMVNAHHLIAARRPRAAREAVA